MAWNIVKEKIIDYIWDMEWMSLKRFSPYLSQFCGLTN